MKEDKFGEMMARRLREMEVEEKKRELTMKIAEAMTDIMPDVVKLLKLMSEEDAYDDE